MNDKQIAFSIGSALLFVSALLLTSSSHAQRSPGTDDGARALLAEFIKPGADVKALSLKLRPTKADYEAVFEKPFATRLEAMYDAPWKSGQIVIAGKPGQTEVLLRKVGTAEIRKWSSEASDVLPGGYKRIASDFKPGQTIYTFKFVKSGEKLGMAYDGLVYVNRQWRIFPKAWRANEE
jgi:hypothetical protein